MTFQEIEARQNFSNFMNDLVSKNGGEMGNKKENTSDAVEKRAMQAIEGARKYQIDLAAKKKAEEKEPKVKQTGSRLAAQSLAMDSLSLLGDD